MLSARPVLHLTLSLGAFLPSDSIPENYHLAGNQKHYKSLYPIQASSQYSTVLAGIIVKSDPSSCQNCSL